MALVSSGKISLGDIAGEFGGTAPHGLKEYYGAAAGIPTGGRISIKDFYGASAFSATLLKTYVSQTGSSSSIMPVSFTVPLDVATSDRLIVVVTGGINGGAPAPADICGSGGVNDGDYFMGGSGLYMGGHVKKVTSNANNTIVLNGSSYDVAAMVFSIKGFTLNAAAESFWGASTAFFGGATSHSFTSNPGVAGAISIPLVNTANIGITGINNTDTSYISPDYRSNEFFAAGVYKHPTSASRTFTGTLDGTPTLAIMNCLYLKPA